MKYIIKPRCKLSVHHRVGEKTFVAQFVRTPAVSILYSTDSLEGGVIDVGVVSARRGSYLAAALYSASVARWEVCRRVLSMLVVVSWLFSWRKCRIHLI